MWIFKMMFENVRLIAFLVLSEIPAVMVHVN